ncbi:M81 family metallopeptidase [Paenibacillus sp. N1-5-1-14]|uniref:M81 family metallopeptidase n=1 Tax=Paenibacillus radicibacter TaxID=2972488 RepID=UPI0021599483|nr:M81 family metallopeptidase [Paenibacillus radicibacter]MCR8641050.1 M81 family metallopeptidase [Paenibacillus radicibacter]
MSIIHSNYRIGIAFFYHESHTFSPVRTDIQAFYDEGYHEGGSILTAYRGTKTEVGGFIDVLEQTGHTIVPLVCAAAIPSGMVTDEAYQEIKQKLLSALQQADDLDGLLLAMHGSMVTPSVSDPESELLELIYQLKGKELPLAITLDMHANISSRMFTHTSMFFGFKTYPHIDMYEQGVHAAHALIDFLNTNKPFHAAFRKLPMMLPSVNMRTEEGPMADMIQAAIGAESDHDIRCATILGGFPYCDIPEAGASVIVVSTNIEKAEEVADRLAAMFWAQRERFVMQLPNIQEAVDMALNRIDANNLTYISNSLNDPADNQTGIPSLTEQNQARLKPIALAEISDNPLSGGTGDVTALLNKLLHRNLASVLFGALYDPESLQACIEAGEGATITLQLGGRLSSEFGKPIHVNADIIRLSDGKFRNTGPMNTGLLIDTKGAAHIRVQQIDILLTGRSLSANDLGLFRHIGLEPTNYQILALKVKNHFRAAFDPILSQVIYVDGPGLASNQFKHFTYHHIPRPIWPLDEI